MLPSIALNPKIPVNNHHETPSAAAKVATTLVTRITGASTERSSPMRAPSTSTRISGMTTHRSRT